MSLPNGALIRKNRSARIFCTTATNSAASSPPPNSPRPITCSRSAPASARFVWDDPFLLEDQLTEDERAIRDVAQSFAQEQLLPGIVEAYATEKTDPGLFRKMGELGLLGVTLPEEYGCAGLNNVSYGLIMQGGSRVVLDAKGPVKVEKAFSLDPAEGQPARLVLDL